MSTINDFLKTHLKEILGKTSISKQTFYATMRGEYELNSRHVREIMILFPEFIEIFIAKESQYDI